jgi:hypothetical protein
VPPDGVSVADPLQTPEQSGLVIDELTVACGGEVNVPVTTAVQPLASVIVTE